LRLYLDLPGSPSFWLSALFSAQSTSSLSP
jgi:hypothetical protein